jgi:type II secretory pathway pseudopilin PulG
MLARIRKAQEENEAASPHELLVVIIIGILAAIAIPVFLKRKKAVDTSMKSDLRTIANEEETYFTDNQAYVGVAAAANPVTIGHDGAAVQRQPGDGPREHGRFGLLRADEPPGRQAAVHAELCTSATRWPAGRGRHRLPGSRRLLIHLYHRSTAGAGTWGPASAAQLKNRAPPRCTT